MYMCVCCSRIITEDYKVPDRMVGFSEYAISVSARPAIRSLWSSLQLVPLNPLPAAHRPSWLPENLM